MAEETNYRFTNNWFGVSKPTWSRLLPKFRPEKLLEIGSFEGASACFLIDTLANSTPLELHCVDTWEGGIESGYQGTDMGSVEERFLHNTGIAVRRAAHNVDLRIHKGMSDFVLSGLLASGKRNFFDFVYVDGSHQAPDVICDAVLGFRLLRVGGVMVFDDYLWAENLPQGKDPLRCPKMAIDDFTNIYWRKISFIHAPSLHQIYLQKTHD